MGRLTAGALYLVAMAAVVVGVDVLVFRNHFWERLAANVGIVLVFAGVLLQLPARRTGFQAPSVALVDVLQRPGMHPWGVGEE
jgi:hypothetical protein